MKEITQFEPRGFYKFESLASARTCYFESKEEVRVFRVLLRRYLKKYVEIHKIFLSSEGYQVLIRIRGKDVLLKQYRERCEKRGLNQRQDFLNEVWRIVSEQIRIFHSVYAKWINRNRERKGVLVQCRYKKYYFESQKSFETYIMVMEKGRTIKGQRNTRYMVSGRWVKLVNWLEIRGMGFVESLMDGVFQNYVVENLINSTFSLHNPPP